MSLYGMVAYTVHSQRLINIHWKRRCVPGSLRCRIWIFAVRYGVYLRANGHSGLCQLTDLSESSLRSSFSVVGLLLITAGLAFKLSLAPFHMWTPAFMRGLRCLPRPIWQQSARQQFSCCYALWKFPSADSDGNAGSTFLIGCTFDLAGNLLALLQQNVKRLLRIFIAHMGYLLIAVVASYYVEGRVGIEAISFYLVAYIIMSLGAFGVTSMVSSSDSERDTIDDYRGLFWGQPLLAAVFTSMMLSLAGIPLTVGFVSSTCFLPALKRRCGRSWRH